MLEIEAYGKVVRKFIGTGAIISEEYQIDGSFMCVQVSDGRIYLRVETNSVLLDIDAIVPFGLSGIFSFLGITNSGFTLTVDKMQCTSSSITLPVVQEDQSDQSIFDHKAIYQFICPSAHFRKEGEFIAKRTVFKLTNLDLGGRKLSINTSIGDILLQPVKNHQDIVSTIKASRGIDITSSLITPYTSIDECMQKCDDISLLLSLARGTAVSWIQYELFTDKDQLFGITLRDSVTRSMNTLHLLRPDQFEETRNYIQTGLSNFAACEENWDIKSAIEAYVESKGQHDYLETRGLKLAVCMELIKGHFLVRQNKVRILPADIFTDELVGNLRRY